MSYYTSGRATRREAEVTPIRALHPVAPMTGDERRAAYSAALRRRWSANTAKLYTGYVRRAADEFDLDTATTDDLMDYMKRHQAWKPRTKCSVINSLRSYYTWCIEEGLRDDNPALRLRPPQIPPSRARKADDETIMRALAVATPVDRAILLLGAECGLRANEIATLRVENRDGDWLSVTGKGSITRMLYLSPETQEALDELERVHAANGWYFPGGAGEGHLDVSRVRWHVQHLTSYNTHALRHRAGTVAYRNSGNDLRLAQAFLGHSSPTTTAIYLHVDQADLIRAAQATRLQR